MLLPESVKYSIRHCITQYSAHYWSSEKLHLHMQSRNQQGTLWHSPVDFCSVFLIANSIMVTAHRSAVPLIFLPKSTSLGQKMEKHHKGLVAPPGEYFSHVGSRVGPCVPGFIGPHGTNVS